MSIRSSVSASASFPLRVYLNSFNDGDPAFLDTFLLLYDSSISDVTIDGEEYASGTQSPVAFTDSISAVVSYTFGGENLTFTITKAAGTHTLGAFTVTAVTEPQSQSDPEPSGDVTDPTTTTSGTSSITVSFTPVSDAAGHLIACSTSETLTAPTDRIVVSTDADCSDGSGYQFSSAAAASGARGKRTAKAAGTTSQSTTWSNLNENTAYYFKVFPFANSGADIDYKTDSAALLKAVTGSTYVASNSGAFGGEKVTPSTYRVTVSKIEFKNSQGEYVTFAEEGSSFDIASVGANSPVGTFGKTATLPNDSYSEIRVTFASTFGLSFSGSDKNTACRTDSSGSTDSVNSTLTAVATGSSDGGSASEQQITYPSGSTADSALSSAGIRTTGGNFQVSKAASFTITDDNLPPSIGINFDAIDSVEVLNSSGTCFVIPQVPSVHVTVGG